MMTDAPFMTEADLVKRIEAHCQRTGESESAFGKRVARDGCLVDDLRNGRSPRMRLARLIWEATSEQSA